MNVISLFSGAGGMDLGFIKAGFNIVFANDYSKEAVETYTYNIGNHVVCGDIRNIDKSIFNEIQADVVIGGFPCQGFSMVGKREENDERNFLYKEMKRVVSIVKPKIFIAENVRGLLSMGNGSVLNYILEEFSNLGYNVSYSLLYAPDYFVPQNRERVFIVGVRSDLNIDFKFPEKQCYSYLTVKDAIGDIDEYNLENNEKIVNWPKYYDLIMNHISEGQKLCNSRHSETSVYTWDIPEVYGSVTEKELIVLTGISKNRRHKIYGDKDGNPLSVESISNITDLDQSEVFSLVQSLIEKDYLKEKTSGKYDITKANFNRFRRLSWNQISPTILTNFDNPRNYIHPSQNRPLTVREVARIQTFPDNFIFKGSIKEQYRQVGNAVPPLLAYYIGLKVLKALKKDS